VEDNGKEDRDGGNQLLLSLAGLRCESVGSVWDKTALISKATNGSVTNSRGPGAACRLEAERKNVFP